MQKWTSLILTLAMTISLAACGGAGDQGQTAEPSASGGSTAPESSFSPAGSDTPEEPAADADRSEVLSPIPALS